jgi:predicted  nucleic acid-binding Zn-ribbon protein
MKEKIEVLVKLQRIEIEKKQIQLKLEDVSAKIEALDNRVNESQSQLESETNQLEELKKQYRRFESDVQMNLASIQKSNDKLRAVKTNKEYQSMLKEIDELKKKNSLIEDEMIACLDQMDGVEQDIKLKTETLAEFEAQAAAEKTAILKESEANRERLSELEIEWQTVSQQVDSDLMQKYITVKAKVKNTALAAVKNSVCQGCNLNLPPQLFNELQRFESLTFCPHCQRIIYWQET